MQSFWGQLTIGVSAVQISTTQLKCCKLFFQMVPGNTGAGKIGGAGLTADNTTPGVWLTSTTSTNSDGSKQPGANWSLESYGDHNVIDASTYYVHGTHAGDLVNYEYHVN